MVHWLGAEKDVPVLITCFGIHAGGASQLAVHVVAANLLWRQTAQSPCETKHSETVAGAPGEVHSTNTRDADRTSHCRGRQFVH